MTLIVVGTVAYLGLAALGRGGLAAFFSHPALIALAFALFAMSGVAFFAGGNLSSGVREDRGNRWVIVAVALIGLLDAFLPAWTDRKEFWTLDGDAIRWLGVVLFTAGGALRIWPVFVLGRRFSGLVAIQRGAYPGHKRHLWCHSQPQLPGIARQFAGVGSCLSFGSRRAAHGAPCPAALRAHARGREAATLTVRR
jgi:hypothetical protein